MEKPLLHVVKRDGTWVSFDKGRIYQAILKAFNATSPTQNHENISQWMTKNVISRIKDSYVHLETIQNFVEEELMREGFYDVAKKYILYREKHSQLRKEKDKETQLKTLVVQCAHYFDDDPLRQLVYYRTYSRWVPDKGRREIWTETVTRYINFMRENIQDKLTEDEYHMITQSILRQEVLPSMRLLQFSGEPARRCNACAYNCSFIQPTTLKDLSEIIYLSCSGVGVGFSVEKASIDQFPCIQPQKGGQPHPYVVEDSKEGWADAFYFCLDKWFQGEDVKVDYSKIRPAGSRLKVMGGTASGRQPLINLIEFSRKVIMENQGKKLKPIHIHDIICKIGEIVVAGGIRRCLAQGSRICGKPIEDIVLGENVLTDQGWRRVTYKFCQGKQEVITITTEKGHVTSTPHHRLALYDNPSTYHWVEVKDLKIGMNLVGIDLVTNYFIPLPILNIRPHEEPVETYDLEVEDRHCFFVEGVLSHNSALISLFDADDVEMRDCKSGQFWMTQPQRMMANNSLIYNTKPSQAQFLENWVSLMKGQSGEPGIFSRSGLRDHLPERRIIKDLTTLGTNPCGEILLQSKEFCNLTSVVCRPGDTQESLFEKIKVATILGTYQSSLIKFHYLSPQWIKHQEEERLLGVSLTGQYDCPLVRQAEVLQKLRSRCIEVNREYAHRLGINPSAAITCVKPEGTLSQLVNSSSGIHPRFSPYYIRRIRISAHDPLFKMIRDQGLPYVPETGQTRENMTTAVLEFPVKSPEGAICAQDLSALDQLEYWLLLKKNYTEHNPSFTCYIGKDEWIQVALWLYEHWDYIGGLSFLPRGDEHIYPLAPYEEIKKEEYEKRKSQFPILDFSKLIYYEKSDQTEVKKELACVGGACEL